MFEVYLEKDLQRYIKIINHLWQNEYSTSSCLSNLIEVSSMTIISDIKFINRNYSIQGEVVIESCSKGYYVSKKNQSNKKRYLQKIFISSLFLRSLIFFLKNGLSDMRKLEQAEYISSSKAYTLKKKVKRYLESLNIVKEGNFDEFSEYKVRFLLAYFQWELGLKVVNISQENIKYYFEFLNDVEKVEGCIFSNASRDYAMLLFQIGLERRMKYFLKFEEVYQNIMLDTDLYKRLEKNIKNFLEKMIRFDIKKSEELYISLVINAMNANYYEGNTQNYESFVHCIENSRKLKYRYLIKKFEETFNVSLESNDIFQASLISFIRKCMLNLQIFIPEEHISLGLVANVPNHIVKQVSNVLMSWSKYTKLDLKFSKDHILQLTTKFFFIVKEKEKRPNKLFLLSSFYPDYLLAKEILTKEFGALIDICQFNPRDLVYKKTDIVLYDVEHETLTSLSCKKIKINYIFDIKELQRIRELLFQYDLKGIEKTNYPNTTSL